MATANWKMEMTLSESLAYLRALQAQAGDLVSHVQTILFPPYTALYAMAQVLGNSPIHLGGQNVSTEAGGARTGEVSARLLADAGARWVLLGHWELRRNLGQTDDTVNRQVHRALEAGLRPVLLVGEERDVAADRAPSALEGQLARVLAGCTARDVAGLAVVYEPEWTIGVAEPAPAEHVDAGCRLIRQWLRGQFGDGTAQAVRILYGGSVSPEHAQALLALPDVDGLGASRRGRDPEAFAAILRLIAQARAGIG